MNHRYGTITTAALAALVLAVAPATAQISKGGAGANVGGSTYNANPSAGVSGNAGVSSTDAISGAKKSNEDVTTSGSVKSDESASGSVKSDQSPSASPPMGDDKAISNQDDRDQMKQQEQIDKKSGLDRAAR